MPAPNGDDLMTQAARAETFSGFRGRLQQAGIWQVLPADLADRLLDAYRAGKSSRMTDRDLTHDLAHWSAGLGFREHLAGFNAVPPAQLLKEAMERGWFCRRLPGGRAVVSPPSGPPLTLVVDG